MKFLGSMHFLIFLSFFLPLIINLRFTKILFNFTNRYDLKFYKEKRRILELNKSRLGGIGIIISSILGLFFVNQISNITSSSVSVLIPISIIITSLSFSFIGILDDLFGLSPFYRLILQIILSTVAWSYGLKIESLSFFFIFSQPIFIQLPEILSLIITILWIAGLTNAVNWLDGLDGLAASFSTITFAIFAILFFDNNANELGFLCLSAMGACIGFLKYNLFPSKIFMGDGGSYFLGSLLACITIFCKLDIFNDVFYQNSNALNSTTIIVPILLFLVPIIDMISVITLRIVNKTSPFYPDKRHFHHTLQNNGLNQNDIVFLTSAMTLWLGFALIFCVNSNPEKMIPVSISFFIFLVTSIFYAIKINKFRLSKLN